MTAEGSLYFLSLQIVFWFCAPPTLRAPVSTDWVLLPSEMVIDEIEDFPYKPFKYTLDLFKTQVYC